jgi:hypothetical protein
VALWQLGVFNQLVQQQTAFYGAHMAEINDENLSQSDRLALAKAATAQAYMLHGRGIGNAGANDGWYRRLTNQVEKNASDLRRAARWWRVSPGLAFAAVVLIIAVGVAVDARSDEKKRPSPPAATSEPAK